MDLVPRLAPPLARAMLAVVKPIVKIERGFRAPRWTPKQDQDRPDEHDASAEGQQLDCEDRPNTTSTRPTAMQKPIARLDGRRREGSLIFGTGCYARAGAAASGGPSCYLQAMFTHCRGSPLPKALLPPPSITPGSP